MSSVLSCSSPALKLAAGTKKARVSLSSILRCAGRKRGSSARRTFGEPDEPVRLVLLKVELPRRKYLERVLELVVGRERDVGERDAVALEHVVDRGRIVAARGGVVGVGRADPDAARRREERVRNRRR